MAPKTPHHAELIERIEAHCEASGMSLSAFGWKTAQDGNLVPRLKAGKDVTAAKWLNIEAFLSDGPTASCLSPNGGQSVNENQPPTGRDFPTEGAQ